MDGTCSTHGETGNESENLKEKYHLGRIDMDNNKIYLKK